MADNLGLITSNLRGTVTSGGMSEYLNQLLLTGKKDIGRGAGRAREAQREMGAASGFRGAGANVVTDIFAEESSQLGTLKTQVGGLAEQAKTTALGQLIGVEQFESGMELSREQLAETARQFDVSTEEGKRQFEKMFGLKERELDAMIEAQGGDFLSVIGELLGTGASIATGGIFGGVASGLGNIFEGFFT